MKMCVGGGKQWSYMVKGGSNLCKANCDRVDKFGCVAPMICQRDYKATKGMCVRTVLSEATEYKAGICFRIISYSYKYIKKHNFEIFINYFTTGIQSERLD